MDWRVTYLEITYSSKIQPIVDRIEQHSMVLHVLNVHTLSLHALSRGFSIAKSLGSSGHHITTRRLGCIIISEFRGIQHILMNTWLNCGSWLFALSHWNQTTCSSTNYCLWEGILISKMWFVLEIKIPSQKQWFIDEQVWFIIIEHP